MIVRALDVPLMISIQLAFVADEWRKLHGSRVRSWLRVAEKWRRSFRLPPTAVNTPPIPFPTCLSSPDLTGFTIGTASLDSMEMGHPFIPAATCVPNNVSLPARVGVLLISGSAGPEKAPCCGPLESMLCSRWPAPRFGPPVSDSARYRSEPAFESMIRCRAEAPGFMRKSHGSANSSI